MKKALYVALILFPLLVNFLWVNPLLAEPEKSNVIIQYQLNSQGGVAILRADGTVELNSTLCDSAHVAKELNYKIAFSDKGLWLLQRDGCVFRWEKKGWLFLIQDPSVQDIVAIDRGLFALRKGGETLHLSMLYQYSPHVKPTWLDIKLGEGLHILNSPLSVKGLGVNGKNILVFIEGDRVAVIPRDIIRQSMMRGFQVELKDIQFTSVTQVFQAFKDVLPDDMPSLQEVIERIVSERVDAEIRDTCPNPSIPMTPGAARWAMIREMAQRDALDRTLLWHLTYHLQEGEYRGQILDALLPLLLKSVRRAAER